MNLNELKEKFVIIDKICELSEQFSVDIKGSCGRNIKIKIWRRLNGNYEPDISHFIFSDKQKGPHSPVFHSHASIEDAFREAINHGLMYYDKENENISWVENEYF